MGTHAPLPALAQRVCYVDKRDNICPCKLSECADKRLDIISADFSCVKGMIDYCSVAPGWFYEPANCWPYHARNISIDVVSGIHHTTKILQYWVIVTAISWPDVSSPLEILVTEVAREDLENFKDELPNDYAEAKSDYIFIRHNGTSQDDVKFYPAHTVRLETQGEHQLLHEDIPARISGEPDRFEVGSGCRDGCKSLPTRRRAEALVLSGQDWYNQNTWTNWYDQNTWTKKR